MELVIIGIGCLVFLAHLFSALFERTRVPDVLPLVFVGLLIGPILGWVDPASFGKIGGIFTTLALVIILFQGGLGLNFSSLKESFAQGSRLTLINFAATILAVAPLAVMFMGISWLEGFMLGAIIGGTSSAVVIPMIGTIKLHERSRTTLFLESAFSDVLCIVVTLALLQSVKDQMLRPGVIAGQIIASFTLASLIGAAGAIFWSTVLDRVRRLENSMFTTPAFVCVVFGLSKLLGFSGAISSLAFGVVLGNIDYIRNIRASSGGLLARLRPIQLSKAEQALFAELVFLLKTFFFVYIGLSIHLTQWSSILQGVLLTVAAFVIRVPVIRLCLDSSTSKKDASLACAIVPKGLAAAVLASMPLQAGLERGVLIQDAVYAVVLFSIILTTALTFLLEKGVISNAYGLLLGNFSQDALEVPARRSADA